MTLARALVATVLCAAACKTAKPPDPRACSEHWSTLYPSQREACAAMEARFALDGLTNVAKVDEGESRIRATAQLCSELGSCAGTCALELGTISGADWSAWPRPKGAPWKNTSCPEFLHVYAASSPADFGQRAGAWARSRVAEFARKACTYLDGGDGARLSCQSVRAGVVGMPGACGKAAASCAQPKAVAP
jgi:hypothetical protein